MKVDGDFQFGNTNKSDAFLKKFPLGKVFALCYNGINSIVMTSEEIGVLIGSNSLQSY